MKNEYEVRGEVTAIFLSHKGNKMETLISTSDLEKVKAFPHKWLVSWSKQTNTYYVTGHLPTLNNKRENIHLNKWITNTDKTMAVENIDKDTLNNVRSNLRIIPKNTTCQNRRGANQNSKSGIRGVTWHKRVKKYQVNLYTDGKKVHVGYFDSIHEAEHAAIDARIKYMPYVVENIS